jgi:hypothetical protein
MLSYDLDTITSQNPLVGQTNLHIGPPLHPHRGAHMHEYVEFNNPRRDRGKFNLIFDFRSLPEQLTVSLQFTQLGTALSLQQAVGIHLIAIRLADNRDHLLFREPRLSHSSLRIESQSLT